MTENVENTATEQTEDEKRARLPKTVAEVQAITHIPTTEATASFGRFINKHLANADNFQPVTDEQAWAVIGIHRVWQQSDERKAEIAELKVAKEAESVERAKAREEAKEKREAEKVEKAKAREEAKAKREADKVEKDAEKARKAAEREAKKAAESDSDADLDSADSEGTGEIKATRKRRAAPKPAEEAEATTEDQPVDGF